MTQNLEPILAKAYKCPICNLILIEKTRQKAEKHVRTPRGLELPAGFVFRRKHTPFISLVQYPQIMWNNVRNDLHGFLHSLIFSYNIKTAKWSNRLIYNVPKDEFITSREFVEGLREGKYRILTPEEFRELKEKSEDFLSRQRENKDGSFRVEDLIRTTPELERIVAGESILETPNENLEPIVTETYRCPTCNKVIFGTLEEAEKRVSIPRGLELPAGFLYGASPNDPSKVEIVINNQVVPCNFWDKEEQHDFSYSKIKYNERDKEANDEERIRFYKNLTYPTPMLFFDTTRRFIEYLKEGHYRILAPEEFSQIIQELETFKLDIHGGKMTIRQYHKLKKLIRTTPELEALVSEIRRSGK